MSDLKKFISDHNPFKSGAAARAADKAKSYNDRQRQTIEDETSEGTPPPAVRSPSGVNAGELGTSWDDRFKR